MKIEIIFKYINLLFINQIKMNTLSYYTMCKNERYGQMIRGMYEESKNINNNYSIVLLTGHYDDVTAINNKIIIYIGEGKKGDQKYTKNNLKCTA